MTGKKVLITAGPTYEAIDPVRFIGNRSSGRTGIELAKYFAKKNHDVTLILGPSHLSVEDDRIKIIRIESAQEMFEMCRSNMLSTDIFIMAAAVADYTPVNRADQKIKKKDGNLTIELKRTTDIAAYIGEQKREDQILVGFALETQNGIENAKRKLNSKKMDMIVLNILSDENPAFGSDHNTVQFIDKYNNNSTFELKPKTEIASEIYHAISKL